MTHQDIAKFLKNGGLTLDKKRLLARLSFCRNMGFDNEEIKSDPSILLISPELLKTRKHILEECGVTRITVSLLAKYNNIAQTRVALLKASGLIPRELDVAKHILNYARADTLPINSSGLGRKRHVEIFVRGDSLPLLDFHQYTILHYLVCFFNDDTLYMMRRYLKTLSFQRLLEAFEVLQSDVQLDKTQLRKNMFLIHCNPQNVLRLLTRYPELGGEDFRELIAKYPKLALSTASDVQAVLKCINEWGFDEKTVVSCPSILTMNIEELIQRLTVLKQIPEIWSLKSSTNILPLLSEKDVILKLRYIQSFPQKIIPTVSLLLSSGSELDSLLARRKYRSSRYFLTLLSVEFKTDIDAITKLIAKHPLWKKGCSQGTLETLNFLRSREYSDEDVLDNLPIVLYPKWFVEKTLNNEVKEVCQRLLSLQNISSKNMELRFCLYFMEMNHQFSGCGIFEENSKEETQPE